MFTRAAEKKHLAKPEVARTSPPSPKASAGEPESMVAQTPLLGTKDIRLYAKEDPVANGDEAVVIPKSRSSPLRISLFELSNDPRHLASPPRLSKGVLVRGVIHRNDFLTKISYADCIHPTESYAFGVITQNLLENSYILSKSKAIRIIDLAAGMGNKPFVEGSFGSPPTDAEFANYFLMTIDAFKLGRSKSMYARLKNVVRSWRIGEAKAVAPETPVFDITLYNEKPTPQLVTSVDFNILSYELPPFEGAGDGEYVSIPFRLPVAASIRISATTRTTIAKFRDPIVVLPRHYLRLKVNVQVPEQQGEGVAAWLGYLSFKAGDQEAGRSPLVCSVVPPIEREPAYYGA